MTMKMKNPLRALPCVASIWFAGLTWFLASAAAAQPSKKPSPPTPAPQSDKSPPPAAAGATEPAPPITVYHLKHAKADEMVRLLAGVLQTQKATLAVDSRTNSLLFQGTPEAARIVEAILMKFDTAESEPDRAMHVFELKYADAQEVAKVLTGTADAKNARWSVDSRRNCIVLYGTREAADLAEKLISELDRPAVPREPEAETRVYQVKYADPTTVLAVLQTMLAGHGGVRVALDPKTNSVVMAAPPEQLKTAAELIKLLDVPKAGGRGVARPAAGQFRIVWLASGLSSKDTPAPADDLKQVVEQLAGLGIKDVRQVGQMVVNTLAEGQFRVRCSPLFDGAPAELTVEGKLDAKAEPIQLDLRIAAKQRRPITVGLAASTNPEARLEGGSVDLVNLDTKISPRFDGSYVVLGVAPVGKVTSIFVVQTTQRTER
jgi:hypothetical protein